MNLDLEYLQQNNTFNGTCDVTVPQAIFVFLESTGFEDSIRKAISIGGDTDTIACMVGSISEAYYGIPEELKNQSLKLHDNNSKEIILLACKYRENYLNKQLNFDNELKEI